MSSKVSYLITTKDEAQRIAVRLANAPLPRPIVVTADFADGRTLRQNAHLQPVCREVAKHMMSHGGPEWSHKKWRHYFVAKFLGQELVSDPDGSGGIVVMNNANGTSDLSKKEASEFLDWIYAFGVEMGVVFDE